MKKRLLLFVLILIIYSFSFAFQYHFPNEILYQPRPFSGFRYTENRMDFFVNTRFSIDTFFNYTINEPLLAGLAQTESSFYIHSVSGSNALGLFQMKPFIADEIGVLNPFNPNIEKKVSTLLNEYTNAFGNVDYALGAYRIGFYGVKRIIDSGKNPLNDKRISDYVQKIHSFQRLYKKGDKIPLKDFIWLDLSISLSQPNNFSSFMVIPNYFLGSTAVGVKKEEEISFSVYQDFSFFWFLSGYIGYDNGIVTGLTLKSNDWYDKITVKYDFSRDDLFWVASFSFDFFTVDLGASKSSLLITPRVVLNDRYFFEIPLFYSEHRFIPGFSVMIRF